MSLVFHGYWRAGAPYRVRIALKLKGVTYENAPVNLVKGEQHGEAYRALNPQGLTPALSTPDGLLTQSLAMELADQDIAVNSLSVRRSIRTPGNIYAKQDPDNPVLQFGAADDMGACVVEICGRPFSYTGHIVIEDGSRLAREA